MFDLLKKFPQQPIFVALSGGLDSVALLQLLVQQGFSSRIQAIHVNHGLSANADDWQVFCQSLCEQLGVQCHARKVQVINQGEGIEAAARDARYQVFSEVVPENAVLLTAHHQDDLLETHMLRLLRGAGIEGLAAIREISKRDHYWLVRPLLGVNKSFLQVKADQHNWQHIEDESNQSDEFDRNFLRNQVLPLIAQRWPNYRKSMARSIAHIQNASELLQDNLVDELNHRLTAEGAFKVPGLAELASNDQLGVVRLWLMSHKLQPSLAQVQQVVDSVALAQADANPIVQIGDKQIRRFKAAMFCISIPKEVTDVPKSMMQDQQFEISGMGKLYFEKQQSAGRESLLKAKYFPLTMQLRDENVTMTPHGRKGSRDLKRLLQEYRVEPWWRDRVPLFYHQDQLVAVGDLFVNQGFQAEAGELGYKVVWQKE